MSLNCGLASPKSQIFNLQSEFARMFFGFRSRWNTLAVKEQNKSALRKISWRVDFHASARKYVHWAKNCFIVLLFVMLVNGSQQVMKKLSFWHFCCHLYEAYKNSQFKHKQIELWIYISAQFQCVYKLIFYGQHSTRSIASHTWVDILQTSEHLVQEKLMMLRSQIIICLYHLCGYHKAQNNCAQDNTPDTCIKVLIQIHLILCTRSSNPHSESNFWHS